MMLIYKGEVGIHKQGREQDQGKEYLLLLSSQNPSQESSYNVATKNITIKLQLS